MIPYMSKDQENLDFSVHESFNTFWEKIRKTFYTINIRYNVNIFKHTAEHTILQTGRNRHNYMRAGQLIFSHRALQNTHTNE